MNHHTIPNEFEKKRTGYKKTVLFINQSNFTITRSINYLINGDKKFMQAKDWTQIDTIWVAKDVQMTFVRGSKAEHQTRLKIKAVSFNNETVVPSLFTADKLGQ